MHIILLLHQYIFNFRAPIMNWIWVVLLSNLSDTQHYRVFESVCLAVYYLGVDSGKRRKEGRNEGKYTEREREGRGGR